MVIGSLNRAKVARFIQLFGVWAAAAALVFLSEGAGAADRELRPVIRNPPAISAEGK